MVLVYEFNSISLASTGDVFFMFAINYNDELNIGLGAR